MSKYNRKSQLEQLESVIENKKREIQEKIEAQKRQETENALKKIQPQPSIPPKRPFWKRNDTKLRKDTKEPTPVDSVTNVFSNDGSFLDKFKKLSKTGLKPDSVDVETLAKAHEAEEQEKERRRRLEEDIARKELERRAWEREREFRRIEREHERESRKDSHRRNLSTDEFSPRTSLGSGIKLNLPPPGVVQIIPQVQLVTPIVMQQRQVLMNAPQMPQFTTNEIQMQANAGFNLPPPEQLLPEIALPNTAQPPPEIPLPNISLPPPKISLPNIAHPPPDFLPEIALPNTSQPPPTATHFVSLHQISSPPPKLPSSAPVATISSIPIPPPLQLSTQVIPSPSPLQVESIPRPPSPPVNPNFIFQPQKLFGIPFFESASQPDSIPLPNLVSPVGRPGGQSDFKYTLDSGARHLARIVAESGDVAEQILRSRNEDDPSLRFLFEPESLTYKQFRRLVEDYRSGKVVETESEPEEIVPSDSESEEIKTLNLGDKYDPLAMDSSDDSDNEPPIKKRDPAAYNASDDEENITGMQKFDDGTEAHREETTEDKHDNSQTKNYDDFDLMPSFSGGENTHKPLSFVSGGSVSLNASADVSRDDAKRRKRSRWGDKSDASSLGIPLPPGVATPSQLGCSLPPASSVAQPMHLPPAIAPFATGTPGPIMLSQVTRRDPGLIAYARQTFGSIDLSEEDWNRAEDHYKISLLYQDMMNKKAELEKLAQKGKFKYEYDSDEEVEGGTWEHKLRVTEMAATEAWATELTRQAEGKHHIGDFLPPDELKRFMEKYNAVKEGREPDLSDYKEFKLREDNVGYQLLQKMGWSEGQGLGQDGQGIVDPVNKASSRLENQGLGIDRTDGLYAGDDEYTAYRKRMMLAYRFRPNPLNNPRRPYY